MRFTMKTRGSSSSRYRMRALAIELRRECRIGQALQECDELVALRPGQGERAKRGFFMRVDRATCVLIMSQHGLQRREASVMHVRCGQRNIAQRRHAHRGRAHAVVRESRLRRRALRVTPGAGKVEPGVTGSAAKTL